MKCPFLLIFFSQLNSIQFFKHGPQGHLSMKSKWIHNPPGEHCWVPYTAVLYSSCPMTNSFYWSCFCLSPLANHKAILSSSFLVFGPHMEPNKYTNMYLNWIECNWNAKSRTWFWIQYRPTNVSFPSGSVVKKICLPKQ